MATIWNEQSREFYVSLDAFQSTLKQLTSRFSKSKKWKKKKINSKYWSSYVQWRNLLLWPLNSVDKIVGKTTILCIIYCISNAVAVIHVYSRNIPIAEKWIVCFQNKKVEVCSFYFIFNNYYIYMKRYFEIFVTNDFLTYSGGQLL